MRYIFGVIMRFFVIIISAIILNGCVSTLPMENNDFSVVLKSEDFHKFGCDSGSDILYGSAEKEKWDLDGGIEISYVFDSRGENVPCPLFLYSFVYVEKYLDDSSSILTGMNLGLYYGRSEDYNYIPIEIDIKNIYQEESYSTVRRGTVIGYSYSGILNGKAVVYLINGYTFETNKEFKEFIMRKLDIVDEYQI